MLEEPIEEPIGFPVKRWRKVKEPMPEIKQLSIKQRLVIAGVCTGIVVGAGAYTVYKVNQFFDANRFHNPIVISIHWQGFTEKRPQPTTPQPKVQSAAELVPVALAATPADTKPEPTPAPVKAAAPVAKVKIPSVDGNIQQKFHDAMMAKWGDESQWVGMKYILDHESGTDPYAVNKTSGACGIPQANPCTKMIKVIGKLSNIDGQVKWMLDYIADRYETPNKAMAFHKTHNWY